MAEERKAGTELTTLTEEQLRRLIPSITSETRESPEICGAAQVLDAVAEALKDLGTIPSGRLYAWLMPQMSFEWAPSGYKLRNEQIAYDCDILHCLAVDRLPPTYTGMRFTECYHCESNDHVKGGGCWTMKIAKRMGRATRLWIIPNLLITPGN